MSSSLQIGKITYLFSLILLFAFLPNISFSQSWTELTEKALQSGYEKDSVYYYLEKAYDKAVDDNDKIHKFYSLKLLVTYSYKYYDLKNVKNNVDRYSREIKKETPGDLKTYYFLEEYLNYAIYYNFLGDYMTSLEYLDLFDQGMNKIPLKDKTFFNFQSENIAYTYRITNLRMQGKFEIAIALLNKYIKENEHPARKLSQNRELFNLKYNRELANIYFILKDYEKSIDINEEILSSTEEWRNSSLIREGIKLNLAKCYLKTHEIDKAEKIMNTVGEKFLNHPSFELFCNQVLVELYIEKNQLEKAINLSNSLIDKMSQLNENPLHPSVIAQRLRQASLYEEFKKFSLAKDIYHSIYEELKILNTASKKVIYKRLILESIYGILRTGVGQNSSKKTELISILLETIDSLQLQYNSQQDKQFLIDTTYRSLQLAFDEVVALYEKQPSDKLVALAFLISEKTKSISLRESQIDTQSKQNKDIPSKVLDEEKILRANVRHYNEKAVEDYLNSEFSDSLYIAVNRFSDFQKGLEINYPKYYNYKYSNRVLGVKETQSLIEINRTIVSYFQSEKAIYALIIDSKDSKIHKLKWDEKDDELVKNFTDQVAQIKFDYQVSSQLYKQLITPLFLDQLPSRLLIIPDGILNYLNFELLKNGDIWMLNSSAISYDESVTLALSNSNSSLKKDTEFVGFAPFYAKSDSSSTRATLAPLSFSKNEIETISHFYDGHYYVGEDGSLERFRESVNNTKNKDNKIYHLASHAEVNLDQPGKSFILFNNGSSEKLYAQDIYKLNMTDSFVALSACETGIGSLRTGQGMRSFSQAFRYAGATSLLHSKWKVSDQSTAFIMSAFYEELAQGKTKDVALQQAKLQYLDNAPDLRSKSPYYWAGFVLTGDVSTLPSDGGNWYWYLLGTFLITFLGVRWYVKKR